MKITKFSHCCLLLEVKGKRIIVDPGRFSDEQNTLTEIDIILITHEHADHFHTDSVTALLELNPTAVVVTNTSVAQLLVSLEVSTHILEGRESVTLCGVNLKAYDGEHVEIVGEFGLVQNTGYLVDESFFFPGDAYTIPTEPVTILALPVAGPWCKVSDAIAYALAVKPATAFPVHDATLSEIGRSVTYPHFKRELTLKGIAFETLERGQRMEF